MRGAAVCAIGVAATVGAGFVACGKLLPPDSNVSDASARTSSDAATPGDDATPPDDASAQGDVSVVCPNGSVVDGGHCYWRGVNGPQGVAQESCKIDGAHLVTIGGAWEQEVVQTFAGGGEVWIGLASDGSTTAPSGFRWITGEATTFTKWQSGQPDDDEPCVMQEAQIGWNNKLCENDYGSVCERE